MKLTGLGIAAAAVGTLLSTPAFASTYIDASSFAAAHPGASTTTFSGATTYISPVSNPYVRGALTLTAMNPTLVSTNFWGSQDSFLDDRFGGFIDATFASSTAVGFYFASDYNDGTPIAFDLLSGGKSLYSGTLTGGGVFSAFSYFGIDGVGAFDELRLDSSGTGGFPSIGPVTLANSAVAAVPEPGTWAMILLGFGAIGLAVRRRRIQTPNAIPQLA